MVVDSCCLVPQCRYIMSRVYRRIGVAAAVVVIAVATAVAVMHFDIAPARGRDGKGSEDVYGDEFPRSSRSEVPVDGLAAEFAGFEDRIDAS